MPIHEGQLTRLLRLQGKQPVMSVGRSLLKNCRHWRNREQISGQKKQRPLRRQKKLSKLQSARDQENGHGFSRSVIAGHSKLVYLQFLRPTDERWWGSRLLTTHFLHLASGPLLPPAEAAVWMISGIQTAAWAPRQPHCRLSAACSELQSQHLQARQTMKSS